MKKLLALLAAVLLIATAAFPALAAADGPVIVRNPQSPVYTEYATALYTVKATGENLHAYWYLEWQGKTYNLSDNTNATEPWEAYAGESYGSPEKNDGSTFTFFFGGIEKELDGAYIWCSVEDGHNDAVSAKARVNVSGTATPPEIVSVPTELTVELGDEAEIRCVAKSSDGGQLSFLWYETDSGKLEDIRAVNRGEETLDTLVCESDAVGTRNYICKVESSAGGVIYSSVVSVTVTEKQAVENGPQVTETTDPDDNETIGATPEPVAEAQKDSGAQTTLLGGGILLLLLILLLPSLLILAGIIVIIVLLVRRKKRAASVETREESATDAGDRPQA